MIIRTKYKLGQTVWSLKSTCSHLQQMECNSCDGTGELELKNGRTVSCQSCGGEGYYGTQMQFHIAIPLKHKVTAVSVVRVAPEYAALCVGAQNRTSYSLDHVPGYNWVEEEKLYGSRAEALKAAREENRKNWRARNKNGFRTTRIWPR